MSFFEDNIARGTRAAQPGAGTVVIGALYFVTDEGVIERSNGTTWDSYSGSGSGDVVGPASSTADALARFDGTTGKLLQDTAAVTLSDAGVFTLPDNQRQTFNPGANAAGLNVGAVAADPDTLVNGDLWYNSTDNTLSARINGASVDLGAGGGGGDVTASGTLTAGQLIVGGGTTVVTTGNLSGDVTTAGGTATTIANDAVTTAKILNANVTLAKIANAAANDKLVGSGNAGSGAPYAEITLGSGLTMTGTTLSASGSGGGTRAITLAIDGGGSAITTGIKADVSVPYTCTITGVRMLADQSGSAVVDIWKDTYANYPPTDADSITAAAPPTISGAVKSEDVTLTGWTTAITAGDTLRFNVDSAATITRLALTLTVTV